MIRELNMLLPGDYIRGVKSFGRMAAGSTEVRTADSLVKKLSIADHQQLLTIFDEDLVESVATNIDQECSEVNFRKWKIRNRLLGRY